MRCDDARQLFDAYLDGELNGPLATEFAAHRVRCASCRRDLALLEVSGHVLASEPDAVAPPADFTDRLLACMHEQSNGLRHRLARWVYIGAPVAAAAVIALAFLGAFDREPALVAGEKVVGVPHAPAPQPAVGEPASPRPMIGTAPPSEEWLARTRKNLATKRDSAESIQEAFGAAAAQWIEILDRAKADESAVPAPPPDAPSDAQNGDGRSDAP